MKHKPGFDDEFVPKGQRRWCPVCSIGQLMMVVAVSGVALSVMAGTGKHKRNARSFPRGARRAVQVPRAKAAPQPRDHFVVTATAETDAKMVVPAQAGLDEAMVFNPYTRDRQSGRVVPAPGSVLMPIPNDQAGQAPAVVYPRVLPAPARPR